MNEEKKTELFSVLAAIDDNVTELERTRDMLQLFDEQLTDGFDLLSKGESWAATYFVRRFHLMRSLLDAVEIQLADSIRSTAESLNAGFTVIRNNKANENAG